MASGTTKKVLFLVGSFTLLKLMAGCIFGCKCPTPELVDLNFSKATITSVNNADSYIFSNESEDSIPAKAIGFKIQLIDSVYENADYGMYARASFPAHFTFFNEAKAMECDCGYYSYKPVKKLSAIWVKTLFDFSPDYKAGSDMTGLFVGYIDDYNYNSRQLYSSLDDLMRYYGAKDKLNKPAIGFSLFLKQAPTSDSLQFEATFEFDDNSFVTDSTSIVYPIF